MNGKQPCTRDGNKLRNKTSAPYCMLLWSSHIHYYVRLLSIAFYCVLLATRCSLSLLHRLTHTHTNFETLLVPFCCLFETYLKSFHFNCHVILNTIIFATVLPNVSFLDMDGLIELNVGSFINCRHEVLKAWRFQYPSIFNTHLKMVFEYYYLFYADGMSRFVGKRTLYVYGDCWWSWTIDEW